MASYAQVATSPLVLEPVARELGLSMTGVELARSVEATVPVDTVITKIAAIHSDPGQAAKIADAVERALLTPLQDSPLITRTELRLYRQVRSKSLRSPLHPRHQSFHLTSVLDS
jgi:capsular polysaccharide biosynthesis protein